MNLLKSQEVRSRDQQQEYAELNHPVLIRKSLSIFRCFITVRSLYSILQEGALDPVKAHINLEGFSRSVISSRTLSCNKLVAKVWEEHFVKLS